MRILHLMRHAKASRDDPSLPDRDRPLAPRGRSDAPRMAAAMAAAGLRPDGVSVSAARRTRETWDLVAPALPPVPVTIEPGLYLCGANALLAHVRALPEAARTVLVVGHNPDVEDLALTLARDAADPADLVRLAEKVPTGAWIELRLDIPHWAAVGRGCGTLARFVRPRDLAPG